MYRGEPDTLGSGEALSERRDTTAHGRQGRHWARAAKRVIDIAGALTFFTVFLPVFAAIALGVKLSSKGPVFYSQDRVGKGGRVFRFYKFRSMHANSEQILLEFLDSDASARSQWDKYQKLPNDPRVTRFGEFIRRTSLDELPQFWNVLRGDMSLVGPRPCMRAQEEFYGPRWNAYCAVRPGLTGLWQVSGRNTLSYGERVRLDAVYVREWSFWLDLRILVRTVGVVWSGHGSH